MARAAIFTGVGEPIEVVEIAIEPPRAGEVKVRLAASGVCHSDLAIQEGTREVPAPLILGHEGAGVIAEVGPEVEDLAVGDKVVLSWVPMCGECFYCERGQGFLCASGKAAMSAGTLLDGTTRASFSGGALTQMNTLGTFAEEAVVPATTAVKVDPEVDLLPASLIGCGVLTGVGAALNTAALEPGCTVAVIGCGGVGLNAIQGARMAAAGRIVAVDRVESKLAKAAEFGATDFVDARAADPVEAVLELTEGRGADAVFEAIGAPPTIAQAVAMTRMGGETILIGVSPAEVTFGELSVYRGVVRPARTIKGCLYGSTNAHQDVPKLIEAERAGRLDLEGLISDVIELDSINDAFAALARGEVTRSVIAYDQEEQ